MVVVQNLQIAAFSYVEKLGLSNSKLDATED